MSHAYLNAPHIHVEQRCKRQRHPTRKAAMVALRGLKGKPNRAGLVQSTGGQTNGRPWFHTGHLPPKRRK